MGRSSKKGSKSKLSATWSEQDLLCGGNYALIPVVLVVFCVTLFMRLYCYDAKLENYAWFPTSLNDATDIFLFYKSVLFIIISVIMLAILISTLTIRKEKFNMEVWMIPLIMFGVLTLISTLVSKYRSYGLSGIYEQFESVWVIIGYAIVAIYTYSFVNNNNDVHVVKKVMAYLLIVMSFIGISQLIGKDFFESDLGRTLIVPTKYASVRDSLEFSFSGSGNHQVYLTLYNPNYVGVFVTLIVPITMGLTWAADKILKKIFWGLITLVMLLCALGSGSKSFFIALVIVVIVGLIFLRKQLLKGLPVILTSVAIIIIMGVAYYGHINIDLFSYIKTALTPVKSEYMVTNVDSEKEGVIFTVNGDTLKLTWVVDNGEVYVQYLDGDNNIVSTEYGETTQYVLDERFRGISSTIYATNDDYEYCVCVWVSSYGGMNFVKDANGYHYYNLNCVTDEIINAPSAVFTGYDGLFTNRGYIWSRSFPLLAKHIILGSGADSFILEFPQQDYLGKAYGHCINSIITRPHCMYLQIGVQCGVIALLCFLAVVGIYLVQSAKIYWNIDGDNSTQIIGLAFSMGILGYMIVGMSNDSSVTVAPLFWVLLGVGFALNRMNEK